MDILWRKSSRLNICDKCAEISPALKQTADFTVSHPRVTWKYMKRVHFQVCTLFKTITHCTKCTSFLEGRHIALCFYERFRLRQFYDEKLQSFSSFDETLKITFLTIWCNFSQDFTRSLSTWYTVWIVNVNYNHTTSLVNKCKIHWGIVIFKQKYYSFLFSSYRAKSV